MSKKHFLSVILLVLPINLEAQILVGVSEPAQFGLPPDVRSITDSIPITVQNKLTESPKISTETIRLETLRGMTKGSWIRTSYKYVITSELRMLPEHYLSVKVRLISIQDGELSVVLSPELRLPSDLTLTFLVPWYEHFSMKARGIIEKKPELPYVYAYCFDSDGKEFANLGVQLPFKILAPLRASKLSKNYRIFGFTDSQEAGDVCRRWSKPSGLSLYDFVITGEISSGPDPRKVLVDVVVWSKNSRVTVGSISEANNPRLIAANLVTYIVNKWSFTP